MSNEDPIKPSDLGLDSASDGVAEPAKLMPGTIARGPTGLMWHYSGPEGDDHLPILGHEWPLVNIAKALLPKDGVFIDVGAHVGLYSLELADKASAVYAWEANEITSARLNSNADLNGLADKIFIMEAAAWDGHARLGMRDPHGKVAGGSTWCEPWQEGQDYVAEADGAPLDLMLEEPVSLSQADLIKIDVEGAERKVLAGARQLISKLKPILFIEMHDYFIGAENRQIVLDQLEELGYSYGPNIPFGPEGGYHLIAQPKDTE